MRCELTRARRLPARIPLNIIFGACMAVLGHKGRRRLRFTPLALVYRRQRFQPVRAVEQTTIRTADGDNVVVAPRLVFHLHVTAALVVARSPATVPSLVDIVRPSNQRIGEIGRPRGVSHNLIRSEPSPTVLRRINVNIASQRLSTTRFVSKSESQVDLWFVSLAQPQAVRSQPSPQRSSIERWLRRLHGTVAPAISTTAQRAHASPTISPPAPDLGTPSNARSVATVSGWQRPDKVGMSSRRSIVGRLPFAMTSPQSEPNSPRQISGMPAIQGLPELRWLPMLDRIQVAKAFAGEMHKLRTVHMRLVDRRNSPSRPIGSLPIVPHPTGPPIAAAPQGLGAKPPASVAVLPSLIGVAVTSDLQKVVALANDQVVRKRIHWLTTRTLIARSRRAAVGYADLAPARNRRKSQRVTSETTDLSLVEQRLPSAPIRNRSVVPLPPVAVAQKQSGSLHWNDLMLTRKSTRLQQRLNRGRQRTRTGQLETISIVAQASPMAHAVVASSIELPGGISSIIGLPQVLARSPLTPAPMHYLRPSSEDAQAAPRPGARAEREVVPVDVAYRQRAEAAIPSKTTTRPAVPAPSPTQKIDVNRLTAEIGRQLEKRMRVELERRGQL